MPRRRALALAVAIASLPLLARADDSVAPYNYRAYVEAEQGGRIHAPTIARVGLGVRGSATVLGEGKYSAGGGGELLVRASRHLTLELAAEYQRSIATSLERQDLPITLGLRAYLVGPQARVAPYLVAAGGIDLAGAEVAGVRQRGLFLEGQLGGGLELRLGRHFSINADARFDARKLLGTPNDSVAPLRSGFSVQVRLGAAVYF
ncbi:MAG TPA: hypothetical protein VH877_25160 [Polyangia bacterium]|jgi:hypothetical protein|nr:hypothetical protein [Polyangia bacterium]